MKKYITSDLAKLPREISRQIRNQANVEENMYSKEKIKLW